MKRILEKTLAALTGKERRRFYVLIMLNIVISVADIISLALLVFLVSFYTGGLKTEAAAKFTSLFGSNSLMPIALFVILFLLKNLASYYISTGQYNYVYKVASRISKNKLLAYLRGTYSEYVTDDSSVQVRNILHQPVEFGHYVLAGVQQVITESVLAFLTIMIILFFNVKLFLLLAITLVPPILLMSYFTKRKLKRARANVRESNEKTLQHLHEALSGYIESNIYDKEDFFTDRYTAYQGKMFQYLADLQTVLGMPSRLVEAFAVLGLFILIIVSKTTAAGSGIEVINIGAFMAAAYKIIPGIVKISNISGQVKTFTFAIPGNAGDDDAKYENISKENIASIQFDKVSFSHKDKRILNDLNLDILPGDLIAIYGPSGKGKTTLINLVMGFLSPDSGTILINNVAADRKSIERYRKNIAYVQQRPFLLNDTVGVNITLAERGGDEQWLRQIAAITGLDNATWPGNVLSKMITENGKNISGGQRQRIALARALYKNADLTILDEPFSELDTQSKQLMMQQFVLLAKQGKMIVLITHNEENLKYCNKTYRI